MADLTKTEYPTMLATIQPSQAVGVLHDRVRTINKINTDIADWLEERRRVEEQYAHALRKLARKQPHDGPSDMGIFTSPWQQIIESTEALADSHQTLALKIESDVEKPLRSYASTNPDLKAMPTIQGKLSSMVRDIEGAQKNADRSKTKTGHDVQEASAQWDSQAPYVFEKLQIVDENRLNHLRDVLTQFQTHEVDQVERNRGTAEHCLNSLLNVETSEEITKFALMHAEGRAPVLDTRRQSRMPVNAAGPSLALPSAFRNDDGASQRSASVHEEKDKKKGFGGFKRLGTVIGRRRQDKEKTVSPAQIESPKRGPVSRFGSAFNLNSDRQSSTTPTRPSGILQNGRAPSSGLLSVMDTSGQDERPVERSVPPVAAAMPSRLARHESADEISPVNGDRSFSPAMNGMSSSKPPQLQEPLQPNTLMTMEQVPLQPSAPATFTPEASTQEPLQPANVVRDYMGYETPASSVDPITAAQQEAASYGDQASQSYNKVDIRNAPIAEEGGDASSAMASLANTLRAQAAPPKRSNTNRGRRDVRNTIFMPSPPVHENSISENYPFPQGNSSMPVMSPTIAALQSSQPRLGTTDDGTGSDSQSIRSTRSATSIGPQTRHPEMTQAGLNSSIVETVSAWFEQGQLQRATVIGEIALAYNQGAFPSGNRTENIRLENFHILEKVAPNPTFIGQTPNRPGEYTVELSSIPRTAVAFKYQVHLEGMDSSVQVPLLIKPTWKVETRQTSVILSYSLNPAFHIQQPITFTSLTLVIHLEGARASGCQSKPTGDFSREKSLILWKLDDVTLRPGEQPQKLLARFATEYEAKPGRVEAQWDITGMRGSGLGVSHLDGSSTSGFDASDPFADESSGNAGGGNWREPQWPLLHALSPALKDSLNTHHCYGRPKQVSIASATVLLPSNTNQTEKEVEGVIRLLTQSHPSIQRETIETYFTKDASFAHPFCRTGSFDNAYGNSRFLIRAIYRWYKIMSPRIEMKVNSVAFDEQNLLLYVNISQVFSIFILPLHRADVNLTTILTLRPVSPAATSSSTPSITHGDAGVPKTKYLISSQTDLYAPEQFLRFVTSGLSDVFVYGAQYAATAGSALGAIALWPVTWWEERQMGGVGEGMGGGYTGKEGLPRRVKGDGVGRMEVRIGEGVRRRIGQGIGSVDVW